MEKKVKYVLQLNVLKTILKKTPHPIIDLDNKTYNTAAERRVYCVKPDVRTCIFIVTGKRVFWERKRSGS